MQLTVDAIQKANATQLVNITFVRDFVDYNGSQKLQLADAIATRTKELGVYDQFNLVLADIYGWDGSSLERHPKTGVILPTIGNYLEVMRNDRHFSKIKFNELTMSGEIHDGQIPRKWTDTDDAQAMYYIEDNYHFLKEQNYTKAIKILFDERRYHPIRDIIDSLQWDGVSRIESFLNKWMLCEDTPYTREASRLIFAGGINRLYRPGCKFDEMIVLIGTNQGEGKSTICRWLALNDQFFSEVTEFEGQRGIEATESAWICEVGELLALTKTKEQEAVKSYLTRQTEKYRMPYDKHVSERPRQCIFIGTTNKEQFLTDKTGNRRYYPVVVLQSGYKLHDQEDECRDYILQCWAEAKQLFDEGNLPAYANRFILEDVKSKQEEAEEDDYRVGMIEQWLCNKNKVCAAQIWTEALNNELGRMTKKDSSEIVTIMSKMPGWKRSRKGTQRFGIYGTQKYWYRVKPITENDSADELPF